MIYAPHLLIVTVSEDNAEDRSYDIECPGVDVGDCRLWLGCKECDQLSEFRRTVRIAMLESDGGGVYHGVNHRVMDGELMVETNSCYLQCEADLYEAIDDIRPQLVEQGAYLVTPDWFDHTTVDLEYRGTMDELAVAFYDREIAPLHVASGVPEDAIDMMRGWYLRDVGGNEEARRQLLRMAPELLGWEK